jgi:hypothetical protein
MRNMRTDSAASRRCAAVRSRAAAAYLPILLATFMRCTLSAARCVQMMESRTSLSACGSMWQPSRPRNGAIFHGALTLDRRFLRRPQSGSALSNQRFDRPSFLTSAARAAQSASVSSATPGQASLSERPLRKASAMMAT